MLCQVVLLSLLSVSLVCSSADLGPCRVWLFPCGSGEWQCTSEETYFDYLRGPRPFCPSLNTTPPPPPATYCNIVDGVCQFTNATVNCTTWFDRCGVQFGCGTPAEQALSQSLCFATPEPELQPSDLCAPRNDSCEWYDPCRSWRGWCQTPYQCGTVDEYYQFLNGPQPLCAAPPPDWVEPTPPGQCIVQNGQCSWFNCTAWLTWCQTGWQCGTQYEEAIYRAGPIPPCAPRDDPPPTQPGECLFDLDSGRCQFDERCVSGKIYTSCGSACPLTCDNYAAPNPVICTQQCVSGCFCPAGTVEYNGGCVDPALCPSTDPCSVVFCSPNTECRVSSTGEAECVASCGGSCRDDQTCTYIPDFQTSVCTNTPSVPCGSTAAHQFCADTERCLVQNKTKEQFCIDSCFLNNGGCGSEEICYNEVDGDCDAQSDHGQCATHIECEELEDIAEDNCPPGWKYSQCGSACESSCETLLNTEQQFRACPAVCVSGCFCERGLIRYRDRCVDPRECYTLVNDPPPIHPLPVKTDVTLISMISISANLYDFKQLDMQSAFLSAVNTLIRGVASHGYVKAQLHGCYPSEVGLQIVIEVSGSINISQLLSYLRINVNQLPLQVESVDVVDTMVIPSPRGTLTGGAIAGIVVGVAAVFVLMIVTAGVILGLIMSHKRKQNNEVAPDKADVLVTYAKLDENTSTDPEIKLPLDET